MLQIPGIPEPGLQFNSQPSPCHIFIPPLERKASSSEEKAYRTASSTFSTPLSSNKIKSPKTHSLKKNSSSNSLCQKAESLKRSPSREWIKQSLQELRRMEKYMQTLRDGADYDDFLILREYRQSLLELQKNYGNCILNNSRSLKAYLNSHIWNIETNMNRLLDVKEINACLKLEKLAAIRRGQIVRNNTVTASQIYELLEGKILEFNDAQLKTASRALARQINEVTENPDIYRGKSVQFKISQKQYPFYRFERNECELISLQFYFWLELSLDAKKIMLFILPPGENLLNQGSYKWVHIAQSFIIDLTARRKNLKSGEEIVKRQTPIYERNGVYTPMVLHVAKNDHAAKIIDRGNAIQQKIHQLNASVQLLEMPKKPASLATGTSSFIPNSLYYQKWVNSDLDQLLKSNDQIPLDFSQSPKELKLKMDDLLDIFIDVAVALKGIHDCGMVHRDIKCDNIFIEAVEEGEKSVKGFPADFDLCQIAGTGKAPDKKHGIDHWDYLSNHGLVTPFTDIYGLAMALGEAFIPNFEKSNINLYDEDLHHNVIWQFIKTNFHKYLNKTELAKSLFGKQPCKKEIERVKMGLIDFATKGIGDIQTYSETLYEEIIIIEKILTLVAKVAAINKMLASTFLITKENSWRTISIKNANEHKTSLKKIDSKLKNAANKFINEIYKLNGIERLEHPLYRALVNPMEFTNQEIVEDCIHTEVQMINPKSEIKKDTIESTVKFAIELKKQHQQAIDEVSKIAIPIDAIITELKNIKETSKLHDRTI